jgi:Domain of unknown function (DUF5667)
MSAGSGEDAQRFATAVELGRSPGSHGDDELSRELEIVAMLRSRSATFDPSPAAKAQAKQRLMALLAADSPVDGRRIGRVLEPAFPVPADRPDSSETDRTVGVGVVPTIDAPAEAAAHDRPSRPAGPAEPRRAGGRHSLPSRPAGRAGGTRPPMTAHRRFSLVGSAALVLGIALAGVGMLSSREAVPGDSLYSVKLVAESAGLALTFDDVTKAHRHLELATTRIDEVEQLVAADPRVTTEDPGLVTSAIEKFDESTGQAARILFEADEESGGGADVRESLRTWAAAQWGRLAQLKPALPPSTGADDALQLLGRVVVRSEAMQVQATCQDAPRSVDDLGPVPACLPEGAAAGLSSDPKLDPTGAPGSGLPSGAPDGSTSAGPPSSPDVTGSTVTPRPDSRTAPGGSSPNTTPRPVEPQDPGQSADPPTGGNVVEGSSPDGSAPTSSPAPEPAPETDQNNSSDDSGLPGLPPVEIPPLLPGLPGISF